MSSPEGFGGPANRPSYGSSLGPGSGYPEHRAKFDPTKPITEQYGGLPGSPPPRPPGPPPGPRRPRRSRAPLLVTLAVVVLAVLVVGAATLYAHVKDTTVAAPTPPAASTAAPSPAGGTPTARATGSATSIQFTSDEGSGVLTILNHSWSNAGDPPPTNGAYLEVEIELQSTDGNLTVSPAYLQAFDAKGELYQSSSSTNHQPPLPDVQLSAGQKATGWVNFDLPRGDVTVLLGDALGDAVAALKVKG